MIDYLKLWVEDVSQIETITSLPFLSFMQGHDVNTGEIKDYPQECEWNCFSFVLFSPTRLQITGSLHKYWNRGHNSNDFDTNNLTESINTLCGILNLNQELALIKNLECGVNICPNFNASEIIEEVVCFKNTRPMRPYEGNNEGFYFIEFKVGNYYLKVYDKGRQFKTKNTLRIELKFMRTKELKTMGVRTLADLNKSEVLQVLGRKLMQQTANIVFNDSTIRTKRLHKKDRRVYEKLVNPNKWVFKTQTKTSYHYREQRRFIEIVKQHGERNHYTEVNLLVSEKINELLKNENCTVFLSKYNRITDTKRYCITCSKPLHPEQKKGSRFCSSRFVGVEAAHRCRNGNSNPRNNFKYKIHKLKARGLLFDVVPFVVNKSLCNSGI